MIKKIQSKSSTRKWCLALSIFLASAVLAQDYVITDFGAIGDSKTLNTEAIQKAINTAHNKGGGRVVVPKGVFRSGSIVLKSNVEFHVSKNGTLLGSTNPKDYLKISRWKSLILADNEINISISGKGIIDGQGGELALHIDSLFYAGEIDSVHYNFVEMRPKYYLRPQLIEFIKCNNIKVLDITLRDAACWVQTYDRCKYLVVDKVKVVSDAYWNNDGIDIVGCQNVQVTNCDINSSDDGICLKTEKKGPDAVCDSIYIANCRVRSSASAVKFGTSAMGDMRNIEIRNIKVYDTYRSAIAIEAVQNGIIENVLIEDVKAKNTGNAIFLKIGQIRSATKPGVMRNVVIRNVKVKVPFKHPDYKYEIRGPELPYFHNVYPSSIIGNPGHLIQDVVLENIIIVHPGKGNQAYASMPLDRIEEIPEYIHKYPEFSMFRELPAWGFYIRHAEGLTMRNVTVKLKNPDYRTAFVLDDVRNSLFQSVAVKGDTKSNDFYLNNSENIQFK